MNAPLKPSEHHGNILLRDKNCPNDCQSETLQKHSNIVQRDSKRSLKCPPNYAEPWAAGKRKTFILTFNYLGLGI